MLPDLSINYSLSGIVDKEAGSWDWYWGWLTVSLMEAWLREFERSFFSMYFCKGEWWICALNTASCGLKFSLLSFIDASYFALLYFLASSGVIPTGRSKNSSYIFCWLTWLYIGDLFSYFLTRSSIEKPSVTLIAPFFFDSCVPW